jgi:hypothetical protein
MKSAAVHAVVSFSKKKKKGGYFLKKIVLLSLKILFMVSVNNSY